MKLNQQMMNRFPLSPFAVIGLIGFLSGSAMAAELAYDRDIAPIFRSYCAGCHNEREMEGEFSLETYAGLREGGDKGDPIRPGESERSYLIRVLEGRSKPKMPPADEPQVPPGELATLKEWIAQGAPGPEEDRSLFSHLVVPQIPAGETARPITALAYAPDGDLRATGWYGSVEVTDRVSGETVLSLRDLPGKVHGLEFSGEGDELLIATGITGLKGLAQLWDLKSGELAAEYGGHRDVLYDAVISPDGQWVATAGYDREIRIWDKSEGKHLRTLTAHQGAVFDLAFHPDSAILASASADETVKLWRVADGVRLDTLNQPQGEQVSVNFTVDGKHILSGGADKRLHCWRLVSVEEPALNPVVHSRFAHESALTGLLCMPDGEHLISTAADRSLKVWSLPDLIEVHAYDPLPDVVATLASIPQLPAFAAARMDGSLQTYGLTRSRRDVRPKGQVPPASTAGTASAQEMTELEESEPNNAPEEALVLTLPSTVSGRIASSGDTDLYRFHARAGQSILLAVEAARSKSLLDSKIEILDLQGRPLEQVLLQATRDSWLTFRGKDSDTSDDFRVHNWAEMELNEYLYANGEVVKLWLYPRGPDSGFKVYPGAGKRHTSYFTTALSHPLGEPCYIVQPLPPGSEIVPNGLPVFPIYWENDDDPLRRWGSDSQLWFDVPRDGEYLVRVSDVRGFGDEEGYHYKLTVRDRRPDFAITVNGKDPKVSPGSGREITFVVERREGFDGEVRIEMENLPEGFTASMPVIIEAGQRAAIGVLRAGTTASAPDEAADKAVKVTARAVVDGREIQKELGDLGDIQLGDPAKVTVEIQRNSESPAAGESDSSMLEFVIRPGETISAQVVAQRHDFEGRIELGGDDSGRNLPHGLYVDNIGLNGLLIVEGQTQREFFITAAPWVPSGERLFHLRATADGGQASAPAVIRVVR